jgi:hypothetical protein
MKAQVQSLKELYRQPNCWEKTTAPIVRFWTEDGTCWGFPYFSVIATQYEPEAERLLIYFGTVAIAIRGLKVLEFFDDFAESSCDRAQGRWERKLFRSRLICPSNLSHDSGRIILAVTMPPRGRFVFKF